MGIDPKVKALAEIIGEGIHTSLRKFCRSFESYTAWKAIDAMPDEEWGRVCEIVANEVIEIMEVNKIIEAKPLCEDEDRLVEQMRKLGRSINNLAKIIEITFGHRDRSVSEILKGGL